MKKGSVKELTKGIKLEKSKLLVPWKTSLSNLCQYGNPETKSQTGNKVFVWKNETILNGITVDLNVQQGEKNELSNVCAYLSESEFLKAKSQLELELGKNGKFRKLNNVEYSYVWKVNKCEITLSHVDRFGSYFKLDIQHKNSLVDKIKNAGSNIKMPKIRKINPAFGNIQFFPMISLQAEVVAFR